MEYVQGTAVAINGRGLLLLGPPGVGKSDLALRLIDRGAQLIADDLVPCTAIRGWPHLSAPTKRIGQLMTRDIGLARLPVISIAVPLAMVLHLHHEAVEHHQQHIHTTAVNGVNVPCFSICPRHGSAPIIAELAFRRWSL